MSDYSQSSSAAASSFAPTSTGTCSKFNCSTAIELKSNPDISGIGVRPCPRPKPSQKRHSNSCLQHVRFFWVSRYQPTSRYSSALPIIGSTLRGLPIQLIASSLTTSPQKQSEGYPRSGAKLFRTLCLHWETRKWLRAYRFLLAVTYN